MNRGLLWADALDAPLVTPKTRSKGNDINTTRNFDMSNLPVYALGFLVQGISGQFKTFGFLYRAGPLGNRRYYLTTSSLSELCAPYILGSRGGSNIFFLIMTISILANDFCRYSVHESQHARRLLGVQYVAGRNIRIFVGGPLFRA